MVVIFNVLQVWFFTRRKYRMLMVQWLMVNGFHTRLCWQSCDISGFTPFTIHHASILHDTTRVLQTHVCMSERVKKSSLTWSALLAVIIYNIRFCFQHHLWLKSIFHPTEERSSSSRWGYAELFLGHHTWVHRLHSWQHTKPYQIIHKMTP